MRINDLIGHEKHGESFHVFLKGRHGSKMVSAQAETLAAAEAALVERVRDRFRGSYTPLCLHFRGACIIVWRDGDQWGYGHLSVDSPHPSGVTGGGWTTQEDVERVARTHLAHMCWDEQEETSPIITNPQDQQAFARWAREEKPRLWRWRKLHEIGWDDNEKRHILGGLYHLLDPARLEILGDPRLVVPQESITPSV